MGVAVHMTLGLGFDSLKLSDRLRKSGLPEEQARAIVEVVRESSEATLAVQTEIAQKVSERTAAELDTKTERAILRLENEIALVRKDVDLVRKDVDLVDQRNASRFKLLYWMFGALITSVLAMVARLTPAALKVYFGH